MFQKKIESFSAFISTNPWKLSLASFIIIFVMVLGLGKLKEDFSHRVWFSETDPLLIEFDQFEKKFGSNDTFSFVLASPNTIFTNENLKALVYATDRVWEIHDVVRVDSLSTYNRSDVDGDELIVEPFINEELEYNLETLDLKRSQAAVDIRIQKYMISSDLKNAVVTGILKPIFKETRDHKKIVKELNVLRDEMRTKYPELKIYYTGMSPLTVAIQEIAFLDLKKIVPILTLIIVLVVYLLFKSFKAVFFTGIMIFLTILGTIGFSGWLQFKFNVITSMLPMILLAVCVADAIHLLTTFYRKLNQGLSTKEAGEAAINKNLKATSLTTISTAVGFFSLSLTDIIPIRNLGAMTGFGTILAWAMTIFFLIPLVILFEKTREKQKEGGFEASSLRLFKFVQKNKRWVVLCFIIFTSSATYFGLQNKVNSSTLDSIDKSVEIRKSSDFLIEKVGGAKVLIAVIKADQGNTIMNPEFLKKVEHFSEKIRKHKFVSQVSSIVEIAKEINQNMNQGDKNFYELPDSQEKVSQSLFLYGMGLPAGMDLGNWYTSDEKELKLNIRYELPGSSYIIPYLEEFKNDAKDIGLGDIEFTGRTALMIGLADYIVETFAKSMGLSLLVISLLMMFAFGSIKLGLIGMIPNIVPPLLGLGLMYFLKIDIDVGTVLIASVCLGIIVDDTIYFINDYSRRKNAGDKTDKALEGVLHETGRALCFTTLVLVLSFSTFALGHFVPNVNFGIITAFVLLMALLTDLFLMPAIFLYLDKD